MIHNPKKHNTHDNANKLWKPQPKPSNQMQIQDTIIFQHLNSTMHQTKCHKDRTQTDELGTRSHSIAHHFLVNNELHL